ncbi:Ca-activated chloride channel family protein [Thermocatellispora tengchongensis]|uniref:Ca-activated chloride channel family protein n=1 Tax=Thermocatellispora tengchongensis TaxID=1073253 RepID=A0A840PKY2_9ACTN|nr:VIT domain-containing protein [Thermocatellispora tengchongensis]MBB5139752.1 Ca-activated chloride channel family protein [Thermocatellispora tengchongensis]
MTVPITSLKPDECRPLPDAGLGALSTERGNLPLQSVDVTADVAGLIAGVEVVQGFRNPYDVPLEATYIFPLPDRAAVTGFRMEAEDRVIEGLLKERGQARADYDRAVSEGRRAAIAEEERPDVFTIRVGNIVPGEKVLVRLTLSQPLPYEDGAATFRFPLVVAPRYIPGAPLGDDQAGDGTAPDTDAVPDASRITPPVLLPGFPNPVDLSLTVNVDPAGLDLREMRSSLHVVREERTGEAATVRLDPGERLDRDFILRLSFAASTSLVLVPDEQERSAGTFSLTVMPPEAPQTRAPRDVVLLLDRSGSMGGWKMVAARRAAARIVDTLTSGDRFAVLSFDSVVERPERLPEGLAEANDRNRYRAVEHLARLEARGGTELLAPLEQALRLLGGAEPARERVLVLVTDGQVGNEDQILERVGAGLSGARVHTVGIDRAVNAGFLGRLAMLGAGRCELVESEDRLDEAMEHIHRRIGAPLVTDLALKAEGVDLVAGSVTRLGSLFSGVPLTVSGRYSAQAGADGAALTVRGLAADGQPWERRVAGTVSANAAVRAIWARAHLRELEDRYAVGERSLEQAIVDTSLKYGVLCRFTAFVAVDTKVVAEGGPQHRVVQPVEPPSGWEPPGAPAAMPMSFAAGAVAASFGGAPEMLASDAGGGAVSGGPAPGGPPPVAGGPVPPPAPAPMAAYPAPRPRGRMFAPGRGSARPVPHPLDAVRPQLAAELDRLRAAESLPAPVRLSLLADLGSRLAALAVYLGGHAELSALAADLAEAERPGADLPGLWERTVRLLTALTEDPGGAGAARRPEQPRTRRAFWKR